jgi:PAS domain S-box-containing protein
MSDFAAEKPLALGRQRAAGTFLRNRILALASACVIGGLALGACMALLWAWREQEAIEQRALASARATMQVADREIAAAVAGLEGLATSPALRSGNLRAFHEQMVAMPAREGIWLALFDTDRQLLSSRRPHDEAPLPRLSDFWPGGQAVTHRLTERREAAISPVAWAPLARAYVVMVSIPVVVDGKVAYLLAAMLSEQHLAAVLDGQRTTEGWRSTLLDRNGTIIAQSRATGRPRGRLAPRNWPSAIPGADPEGAFFGEDQPGRPALVTYSRSPWSDWTAVVEVPRAMVTAPMRRTLLILTAGGILLAAAIITAVPLANGIQQLCETLRSLALRADARQLEAEMHYRLYWNHTAEALFVVRVGEDGRFVFEGINKAHERQSGLSSAALTGRQPSECLRPDIAEAVEANYRRCVATGGPLRYEETLDLPGGRRDWETCLVPVRDPATGRIMRLLGSARDVTDRRRTEAALRESEERLRLAQEAAGIGTWDWDLATGKVHWSPEFHRVLGFGVKPATGSDPHDAWLRLVHPEDRGRVEAMLAAALEGGSFNCEYRVRSEPGGQWHWLVSRGGLSQSEGPDRGRDGARMLGMSMDITERKRAEEQRDEALGLFRAIADTSPDILYVFEVQTRRNLYINRRANEILGYGPAELAAMERDGIASLVHPDDVARVEEHLRRCRGLGNGEIAAIEYRVRHQNGGWHWLSSRETVFARDQDGAVTRILGCARDVTAERRTERWLRKLGGRLLTLQDDERRRIARELHDSTAQLLLGAAFAITRVRAVLPELPEDADAAVEEALTLIEESQREIRTLAYLLHPPLLDEMGLPAALRWYAKGLTRRCGLEIAVDIAPELAARRLPRDTETALFRVAQEALANAHRHSGGRRVEIRLSAMAAAPDGSDAVMLSIRDDGRGVPREYRLLAHGDDPAFIGVGLAGMHERMRQLGGQLVVRPGRPTGTVVEAVVSAAAGMADAAGHGRPLAEQPAERPTSATAGRG